MFNQHGLIIGKFYPPHAGHDLLIATAARTCERVTVIVMPASHESISMSSRVSWLRQTHTDKKNVVITGIMDDLPIDHHSAAIWELHVALMQNALQNIGAPNVTAVFSSEAYGVELARRFNAIPVILDESRTLRPISSTAIRSDILGNWASLAPATRAGLTLRVSVVGAESSGTTTLSRQLFKHFRSRGGSYDETAWVAEYGRQYSTEKWATARAMASLRGHRQPCLEELVWTTPEFIQIAKMQNSMEDAAARGGGPILICDTDSFATSIWHERYVGSVSRDVVRLAEDSPKALTIVTDHEGVAFEQDGLRDGEHLRTWMTRRFARQLADAGRRYVIVSGSPEQRLAQAIDAIDKAVSLHWQFPPPFMPRSS